MVDHHRKPSGNDGWGTHMMGLGALSCNWWLGRMKWDVIILPLLLHCCDFRKTCVAKRALFKREYFIIRVRTTRRPNRPASACNLRKRGRKQGFEGSGQRAGKCWTENGGGVPVSSKASQHHRTRTDQGMMLGFQLHLLVILCPAV